MAVWSFHFTCILMKQKVRDTLNKNPAYFYQRPAPEYPSLPET